MTKNFFISADFKLIVIDGLYVLYMWSIYYSNIHSFDHKFVDNSLVFDSDLDYIVSNETNLLHSFLESILCISNLNKLEKKIYVYIHDLDNFSGNLILNYLLHNNLLEENLKNIIIRANAIYTIETRNIIFLDSLKLLLEPLNILCDTYLQKNYRSLPSLPEINTQNIFLNKKKILCHCSLSSNLLFMILVKFQASLFIITNKCITGSSTLSTMAFKLYKESCSYDFNNISNSVKYSENIYDMLKESYRGGIVEVYKPYTNNAYQLDINSSYPNAMLNAMPIGTPSYINNVYFTKYYDIFSKSWKSFFGFITLTLFIDSSEYIPLLGIREKNSRSLIYPVGVITSTFFSQELKYAFKVNNIKILRIYKMISYSKGSIFNKFINCIYDLKKINKGNSLEHIYKLILNSLYGRMGLSKKIDKSQFVRSVDLDLYEYIFDVDTLFNKDSSNLLITLSNKHSRDLLNNVDFSCLSSIHKKKIKSLYNNILIRENSIFNALHISSAITSYARINIDRIKRKLLMSGGVLVYSDTDSIVCKANNLHLLDIGESIGQLKIEKEILVGYFIAPKAYYIKYTTGETVIRLKGISTSQLNYMKVDVNLFKDIVDCKFKFLAHKWTINAPKNLYNTSDISVVKTYMLSFNLSKRSKIYNNGVWVNTKPLSN